jgi:hypothetical protein
MSSLKDLYNSGSPSEISLRDEFVSTRDGSPIEIEKFHPVLLRLMRKINGEKVPCECVDKLTREPDRDRLCLICLGEGFKWDEVFDRAYRALLTPKEVQRPAGLINVPLVVFYMRHDTPITNDDKVIEVILDLEGLSTQPTKRSAIHRVQHVESYRLDQGRVEYLKIWAFKEDVKHL